LRSRTIEAVGALIELQEQYDIAHQNLVEIDARVQEFAPLLEAVAQATEYLEVDAVMWSDIVSDLESHYGADPAQR